MYVLMLHTGSHEDKDSNPVYVFNECSQEKRDEILSREKDRLLYCIAKYVTNTTEAWRTSGWDDHVKACGFTYSISHEAIYSFYYSMVEVPLKEIP